MEHLTLRQLGNMLKRGAISVSAGIPDLDAKFHDLFDQMVNDYKSAKGGDGNPTTGLAAGTLLANQPKADNQREPGTAIRLER